MTIWHYFFDWYQGQVWPNLVASILTTAVVWVVGIRKLLKLHKANHADLKTHISTELARYDAGNISDLSQFTKITDKSKA